MITISTPSPSGEGASKIFNPVKFVLLSSTLGVSYILISSGLATSPRIFICLTSAQNSVSLRGAIRSHAEGIRSNETLTLVSTSTRLSAGVYLTGVPLTVAIE